MLIECSGRRVWSRRAHGAPLELTRFHFDVYYKAPLFAPTSLAGSRRCVHKTARISSLIFLCHNYNRIVSHRRTHCSIELRCSSSGYRLIILCCPSVQRYIASVCFYRAMHFSAYARSWDRMSSVCLSVRLSVTLVICDHIGLKSWKLTAQAISTTPSLFAA